ncbi:MAG TPA: hypothetical protein VGF18_02275 [Candidatus Tumulicola sp.]|jgi:hypothetical protein
MVRISLPRRFMCAALLGASIAWPVAAAADDTSSTPYTHYSTAITTVYGSQYPIAGHLDLQLYSSGVVRGYYHNAYQKAFIQVVGGRDGSYIWFDIGPSPVDLGIGVAPNARLHIVATMNTDGSFRGQAYPLNPGIAAATIGNQDLSGTQTGGGVRYAYNQYNPNPSNGDSAADQYIFAGKPQDSSGDDYPQTAPSPQP